MNWQRMNGPLAAERIGTGRRMVFSHGFTQTANSWKPVAERLAADGFECVVVDLPGHGNSSSVRADLRRGADLLTAVGGPATYIGYSMGGRFSLHAAVIYPHLVERMILIGAHPGLDDEDERSARRNNDDALAARLAEVGVSMFLDEWLSQPIFAGLTISPQERADRERNTIDGLSNSLSLAGTGSQISQWPRLHELSMPILFIAGSNDEKFSAVGRQIVDEVLDGKLELVPYCGHSVVLQAPDEVRNAILRFVSND